MLHQLWLFLLLMAGYSSTVEAQSLRFLSPQPFTAYVPSGASPGRRAYQVYAAGTNGTLSYSIVESDSANPSLFSINNGTGLITNTAPYPSTPNQYRITVQASLSGYSISSNLTIIVLPSFDATPRFERTSYVTSITENGLSPFSLLATQAFSLSTTNNIVYTIVSGNMGGVFSISSTTGIITVTTPLDRETHSQYLLTVRYIDDVGSIDTQVQVLVTDMNDNGPVFNNSYYYYTIEEGVAFGRPVGSVSATDPDNGLNGTISYSLSGPNSNKFSVSSDGLVSTAAVLNYEELVQFSLTVTASDNGDPPQSSTAALVIQLNNTDDECPSFSGSVYVKDVPYDFTSPPVIGDHILTIEAYDPDNIGGVSYSLISGNDEGVFQLDPVSGNISIARNEEAIRGQYVLIVAASDATCVNISRAQVEIGIGSANEHSPTFDESTCTASLTENPPNGTFVTQVVAMDDDFGANGRITYDILPNIGDFELFEVNPSTGVVTTTQESRNYDRESRSRFQVGITATDGGYRQDFCILTINLLDENDNEPIFDLSEYSTNIGDTPINGSYIIQVQAQDMDFGSNGEILYTLNNTSSGNCPFLIDQFTGTITVSSSVLTTSNCVLNITASDQGLVPRHSSVIVNITILHDGKVPVFSSSSYNVTIPEDYSSSKAVINVTASVSGNSFISYHLINGLEYHTNSLGNFRIFPSSGEIRIESNKPIDYERLYPGPYSFRLQVTASAANVFSSTTVTVHVTDVNDNFPTFPDTDGDPSTPPTITFNVVEGQPPGPVGIVKATDNDTGINGVIQYELRSAVPPNSNFTVDQNGTVYSLATGLDAEAVSMNYMLTIGAFNPGVPNQEGIIHVFIAIEDINDNRPVFTQSVYNILLNETQLVPHLALELTANDPDRNDQGRLVYAILSGNTEATFQLRNNAGKGELYLRRSLDYERYTQYSLSVQVSDGIYTDTATVSVLVINVDDEPPIFSQSLYTASVVENSPIGTVVLTVNATDLDSNMIQYELKGLAEGRFSIDNNGVIRISGGIDREEFLPSEEIVFLVFAYGGSLSTADTSIHIDDINDYYPQFLFAPFYGTAPENTPPGPQGLYITTVRAVDLDKEENGTLTYSLVTGEKDGFSIDPVTGVIIANRTFDRETTRFFQLVTMATDNGGAIQLSSTVEVIVEISDHNDNQPSWVYPYMYARVYENEALGHVVIQLPATDPDNGVNATVFFTLISGNDDNKFNLTASTGEVRVAGSLDYENLAERRYLLYFSIMDGGTPPLSSPNVGELEIHVLDDNDHSPLFDTHYSSIVLPEDTPINAHLITLTATDTDQGTNSLLSYGISDGDLNHDFDLISHSNGSVTLILARDLDFESRPNYTLSLTVTDHGYPPLTDRAIINITLTDVNDEPPLFSRSHFTGSIEENMNTLPVSLLYTGATDPDSDEIPGGLVDRYELVWSDDTNNNFNYNNGWLTVVQSLDRETKAQYHFIVQAIDNDPISPLSSTATITVTVLDVNDHPSQNGGQLQVLIQAQDVRFPAQELGLVYFIDSDDNDTFTACSIVSGDNHLFNIHSSNCSLYSTVSDFPAGVSYGVEVRGHDGVHDFVMTTVSIIMHNASVVPPVSSLISITLNVSGDQYLDQFRSSIVNVISDTVSVQSTSLNILTVQQGHHDPVNTVDLLFAVMSSNGVFMDPTYIINKLYLERSSIYSNLLYSLPVDACINEPCTNLGQCTTILSISTNHTSRLASKWYILFNPLTSVSYQCSCLLGTTGDHCEVNYDDCYSNPCQYGGTCTDGIQDYTCTCPEGTAGKDCSINNDECASSPCINGGTCTNGFNRHECICPVGYYGDRCEYAYFIPSSFCDSSPCLNNGTCSNGRDSFTCVCSSDFIGRFCEQSAQFQGGCSNNPCYNGSTCTETTNGYTCTCSVGFTGPNCRFPLNNCELEYCRNGGTCERGLYGAYNCLCPFGYGGQYCTELLSLCHSSPCLNGGTCIGNTSSYTCTCTRGYYGDTCQYPIAPTNLCTTLSPCNSTSVCSPGSGNYTCVCTDGSGGDDCSLMLPSPSPCDSNPCLHGGQCTNNSPLSFQCTCPVGYTGPNCEDDINECSPNPCSNNGICYNGFGSYICTCITGFTGRECQIQCPAGHDGENCEININYCRPDSCSNGGSCIETDDGYTCTCPPSYTGPNCSVANDCNVNTCTNSGQCTNDTANGFRCTCRDEEMRDDHCRLNTVSFNGDQSTPSYRAYGSIDFRSNGDIQFDFSTQSSNGVLLFNTQHQGGISADFISVEISGGILLIKYSLGGADNINNVSILSTSVSVADGHWHTLLINIRGNSLVATLDYCIQLMETHSSLDCTASITANTNYSSLELGLPLWLGGVPVSAPLLPAGGINACIRNLLMDRVKIDLGNHVEEMNSQNGCPQIYNSCDGITCNEGSCTPLWYDYICICPHRITGRNCTQEAQGLTFNGRSLLWYSLVVARGGRTRRQTTPTQSLSNYRESVSLWFRTEENNGVLFIIGRITGEHLMIKLQDGRLHHSINLGSVTDTFTTASTHHDGRWHHINISRVGLISQINIDDTRINLTHSGPEITLEYSSNQIYFSGNLLSNQTVTDGYTGCIQDVRLDHTPLPVADSNQYASVTYIGDTPESGCRVGPCYPNPCNTGTCTETTHNTFLCTCNGRSQTSPCDTPNSNNTIIGIAVAVAILIFISVLIAVLVIGLLIISKYGKRKKKYSLSDTVLGRGGVGRSNEHIEIHANLYAYDEEGGEQDTSVNNGNHDNTMDHSPIVNEGRYSPSMSTLERNRDYDIPRGRKQFTPSSLKKMRENNPPPVPPHSETPPTGMTPPVRGTPSLKGRGDSAHSTPPVHHLLHPVQETPPITIMPSPHLPIKEEGTKEQPIAVSTPPLPQAKPSASVSDRVTSELRTKGILPLIVNQPERASTPDIDRFIEDKVNNANNTVQDIDSLREYSDEGIEINDGGSLSDISQVSFELYTFRQLREAGDPFTNVADILEPVYDEEESEEDSDTSTEGGGD